MKPLDELIDAVWPEVLKRFNQPRLEKPRPTKGLELLQLPTAAFNFEDNSTLINPRFIKEMVDLGMTPEDATLGVSDHEVAHYMSNPRDLAQLLVHLEAAECFFGKETEKVRGIIANLYEDAAVNLDRMSRKDAGKQLRQLYETMERREFGLSNQLLNIFYADRIPFFTTTLKGKSGWDKLIERLRTIDFKNDDDASNNIYTFGEIILPLLKEDMKNGKGGHSLADMLGEIGDMPDQVIEDALNKIAQKYGIGHWKRVKKFVNQKRGEKGKKPIEAEKRDEQKVAGLEGSELQWNNDVIPWYRERAVGKGVYVYKKPLKVDAALAYRDEVKRFRLEDPLALLKHFMTPQIIPSVTQRYELKPGTRPDLKMRYPDLMVSLDTSGSMEHPRYQSMAVLAAFVFGLNYHINGSKVGLFNFSADSAMLFPTRELDEYYRMACAWFGGGTVYDVDKFKEYMQTLAFQQELQKAGIKGVSYSSEKDYERLINSLDPETAKKFKRKSIAIKLDQHTKEAYERLDHIMITDGGIANLPTVINYFNSISGYTRNTVILIGNDKLAEEWEKLGLENTQIVSVAKDADLAGMAIGKVKTMQCYASMQK